MDRSRCILAVEDRLSEAVGHKLLVYFDMEPTTTIGNRGSDYLKKRARDLNRTAKGFPVFLLTDQDSPKRCPIEIMKGWLRAPCNEGFIFRIAVMEIESWIMADRQAFASFIGIDTNDISDNPDSIENPKEFMLDLVRKHGKRDLKNALLPSPGSTARVGPEYNPVMSRFVARQWDVRRAGSESPSLQRAISALDSFKSQR